MPIIRVRSLVGTFLGLTDYYRDETRRRFGEVMKIRANLGDEMKLRMAHPSMAAWWLTPTRVADVSFHAPRNLKIL